VVTGALAWSTSGDVQATRDLATVARDDASRPLIIVQAKPTFRVVTASSVSGLASPNAVVELQVRNIGRGPARDVGIRVAWSQLPNLPEKHAATVEIGPAFISSLMPGEVLDVTCLAAIYNTILDAYFWEKDSGAAGHFNVAIAFNDWNGSPQSESPWSGNTPTGTAQQ
jgi:hypothetical protein